MKCIAALACLALLAACGADGPPSPPETDLGLTVSSDGVEAYGGLGLRRGNVGLWIGL